MKLIVGNWKMYPATFAEAKAIYASIVRGSKGIRSTLVIAPPLAYLGAFAGKKSAIHLGAQDASLYEGTGARTGNVSAQQISSTGAEYVIIGHSERRADGESDETIAKKVAIVTNLGVTAILCVGERERDRDASYFSFVRSQIRTAFEGLPTGRSKSLVIAYEPIWAIGAQAKGAATPEIVREMTMYIRKELTTLFGKSGRTIPVLYGGSVDERNARDYLTVSGADGLLIGRVSLEPSRLLAIAKDAGKS